MAVRLATSADYLRRTTGLLNPAVPSTVMLWVKSGTISIGPAYQTAYILMDDPGVYTAYAGLFLYNDGAAHCHLLDVNGTTINTNTPTVDVWMHYCWTQSGTTIQSLYTNGALINSITKNRAADVLGFEYIGNDTFSDGNLTVAYMRQWDVALTAAEILTEMQSATAVKTASLWLDCPFTANLNDTSGNGRNYTLVGADSFVASPSFPANSLPSTATVLSGLPTSVTTDFGDAFYGWYTYQSVPADLCAGFLARSNLTDTLTVGMFTGTASSMTTFGLPAVNQPLTVPTAGGDTWFFKVSSGTTAPTDDVVVDGQLPPTDAVSEGDIAVNDDGNYTTDGGVSPPATFLNGSGGTTLRHALAAAGEAGNVMASTGQVCLYDVNTATVQLFDAALGTPTSTIDEADFFGGGPVKAISTDESTQFYVGGGQSGTTCHVKTLSPTGVIGSTDYAITIAGATNLACIGASQDNTILYYGNTTANAVVRRWDLVNNLVLSNLAAGVANHVLCTDILVLSDGTVIVGYIKSTATTDYFIRQYSAAGATLNTYSSFGATNRINRMAMAIDDPTSFWVWLYLDDDPATDFGGSVSRFINVNVADGATLSSFDAVNFEGGRNTAEPSADPLRFGHSFSCPFWINRVGETPTPALNTREYLIRRERWFPHFNQEQLRAFFNKIQIDLQAGNGITEGQGENPLLELDWSDDGGWTWSSIRFIETGRLGQYDRRAIARQLGQSRNRVFRIAVSDPVQWSIISGYVQAVLGTS